MLLSYGGLAYRANLAGRVEVGSNSALLSDDLFLQVMHDIAMFPLE